MEIKRIKKLQKSVMHEMKIIVTEFWSTSWSDMEYSFISPFNLQPVKI